MRLRVFLRSLAFAFAHALLRGRRLVTRLRWLWSPDTPHDANAEDEASGIDKSWRGFYMHRKGRAGEIQTVEVSPDCYFQAKRLIATDSLGGTKTVISMILIGQRLQLPAVSVGILTQAFDREAVGNDIDFDVCAPGLMIVFQITYLADCTWSGELWGKWSPEEFDSSSRDMQQHVEDQMDEAERLRATIEGGLTPEQQAQQRLEQLLREVAPERFR